METDLGSSVRKSSLLSKHHHAKVILGGETRKAGGVGHGNTHNLNPSTREAKTGKITVKSGIGSFTRCDTTSKKQKEGEKEEVRKKSWGRGRWLWEFQGDQSSLLITRRGPSEPE